MTLVELLVAMALTAVLGTLLVTFLMTSHRVSVQELSRVSGRDQLLACISAFRRDLNLSSPDGVSVALDGRALLIGQRPEATQWSGQAVAYRFENGILRRAMVDEQVPVLKGKFKVDSPISLSGTDMDALFGAQFPNQSRQYQLTRWLVTKLDSRTWKLRAEAQVGQSSLGLDSVVSLRL